MTADEQATLGTFATAGEDTDDVATEADEDTLDAVLGVLDRQTELLERVVDEVAAEPTPTDRTTDHADTDADTPAPVSRAFW